jgi:predicted RNA-binding protein with PIN domain
MVKHYIIDGNNLIGKIASIWILQQKDKQAAREQLTFIVDRFFGQKKFEVTLHFDGYKNDAINSQNLRIQYSGSRTADELIKKEIMNSKNSREICLVSSDNNLIEFARVCECMVENSENFAAELSHNDIPDEEKKRTDEIDNDEIKKLFGVQ